MNAHCSKKNAKKAFLAFRPSAPVSLRALKDENQKLRQKVLFFQQKMQRFLESEEKYRILTEKSPNMIFINQGGRIVYANPRCEEVMGYKRREFYASRFSFFTLMHPEDIPAVQRNFLAHQKGKEVAPHEHRMITKNGEVVHGILTTKLIHYRGAAAILGIITDITERKRAEEALRKSEKRYRNIFESSHDAMMTVEPPSWKFTSANISMVRMFRAKNKAELFSHGPWDLSPARQPDGRASAEKAKKMIWTAMRKGVHFFEWTHRRIDGQTFSTEVLLTRVEKEGGAFLHATVRDITERKRIERELKETKERLEYILGVTKTGVDVIDGHFNLHYVDPAWQKIYGDFKRRKCYEYFMGRKKVCPGCGIPIALKTRKTTITEEVLPREGNRRIEVHTIPYRDPGGKWLVAEFNVDITERKRAEDALREHRRQLLQIIDAVPHMIFAKDQQGRFLLVNRATAEAYQKEPKDLIGIRRQDIHKDHRQIREFRKGDREVLASGKPRLVSNEPFTDGRGQKHVLQTIKIPFKMAGIKRMCILGVSVDVTEQRKVEEFRNDIVRTVSHELRTPLSIEKEGISLLMDEMVGPVSVEQKEILGTVMRSIDRLARMITSLLDISSIETGKIKLSKKMTDLGDIAKDVAFEFKKRAGEKGIDLSIRLPERAVPVFADPDKIMQVLSNLVDNAIKFTPGKGTVEISLVVSKNTVKCEVRDSGIGIAPENIGKAFEKFQQFSRTTGSGEKGFGLGLSIASGIIELHGGQIRIKSELGKGTRVMFSLPLCGLGEPRRIVGGPFYQEKKG